MRMDSREAKKETKQRPLVLYELLIAIAIVVIGLKSSIPTKGG